MSRRTLSGLAGAAFLLAAFAAPAQAAFSTCAVPWSNFTNLRDYTLGGEIVRDHELSADPTNGGASVPPAETDLASGSPGSFPGPRTTPGFAYWNGGTTWDPLTPSTAEDDHVLFRLRLRGTPRTSKDDFSSYHWNILFDVDGDGYKEYWIDINGTYQASGTTDQVQVLYSNLNSQVIDDPNAARVSEFSASALPLTTVGCTGAGSPGLSHTRTFPVNDPTLGDVTDLSGDHILEVQIPLTAFNDLQGNQVVLPNSPIAFMFSTSASNVDPLQKDLMADIDYLASTEPITFGDVVTFAGIPVVRFVTATGDDILAYYPGDPIYVELTYPGANTDPAAVECTSVTVNNPYTGDTETVSVCETSANSGVFMNWAGSCNKVTWNDGDLGFDKDSGEAANLNGWLVGITPTAATTTATWTLRYVDATGTANDGWDVYRNGTPVTTLATRLKPGSSGTTFTHGEVSFQLYQDVPVNNDSIQFCLQPPLGSSTSSLSTGILQMNPGDTIFAVYPSLSNVQTSDSAIVLGVSTPLPPSPTPEQIAACLASSSTYLSRAEGTSTNLFQVASTEATSDRYWVTVLDAARNTNTTTAQSFSVTVSSLLTGDSQTFTLTETGVNTGEFRNGTGQGLKLTDGSVAANDGTLEVGDADTLTATYVNACGATQTDTASTDSAAGGIIAFTDSTGTLDGTHYTEGDSVFVKVTDTTWSTCTGTFTVTLQSCPAGSFTSPPAFCSSVRDTETVTVAQTAAGSGQFMNVGVGTTAITAATFDGTAVAGDLFLEALEGDILIASYVDCNDGDTLTTNNTKTDTATYFSEPGVSSITEIAAATRATLLGIKVDLSGLVEFATGAQKGTKSFRLFETDLPQGGELTALHDEPIAASRPDSVTPTLYRATTRPLTRPYLVIEETETSGEKRVLATVSVSDTRLSSAFDRISARVERAEATRRATAPRPGKKSRRTAQLSGAAVGALKIETTGSGLVQVPWSTLASMGAPSKASGVKLTNRDQPVPYSVVSTAAGPALQFDAANLRADYTITNRYVLSWGGARVGSFAGLTGERTAAPGFVRIERTGVYASSAPLSVDPFQWDLLTAVEDLGMWGGEGDPVWPYAWWWPEDGRFDLPAVDPSNGAQAAIRIRFLGASAHNHSVEAWLNGVPVGSLSFSGSGEATLTGSVDSSVLRVTGNQLELRYSSGAPGGYLYFDGLDIQAAWAASPSTASVVDIGPLDSTLPSTSGVRYLIVTHQDFSEAAARIAAAKEAEGLRTAVVSVERTYDRFTAGIVDPSAIQATIREFAGNGSLQYVLLVGDDSLDPTDQFGYGSTFFLPSYQAWSVNGGRFATENAYADLDGDGAPDVAIGRLPVQTAAEALSVAAKIERGRSAVAAHASRQTLAVDDGFLRKGSMVRAWLPGDATLTVADTAAGVEAARAVLFDSLRAGSSVTHYFGHGGPSIWADEWLLSTDDVAALEGAPESVFFMWACQAQWYQYFWGSSLGEALLLQPFGGSIASFGPTGITSDDDQALLASALYPKVFNEGLSLGQAILQAKRAAAASGKTDVVEGFVLFGDPALVVRPRN